MTIDNLRTPLNAAPLMAPKCGQSLHYVKDEMDERVAHSPDRLCVKCGQEVTPDPIGFMGKTYCPKCLGVITKYEALHAVFCDRPEPCKCGDK